MGGTVTDPFGKSAIVNQFVVFADADEGEAPAKFGWSRVFATWDIATKPVGFPYVYSAVIALCEKDDGGFYQFLKDLWNMVDEVRDQTRSPASSARPSARRSARSSRASAQPSAPSSGSSSARSSDGSSTGRTTRTTSSA